MRDTKSKKPRSSEGAHRPNGTATRDVDVLLTKLQAHKYRSLEDEKSALQTLLDQADERQRVDEAERETIKERYRRLGGSPLERLPFELLNAILQNLLELNWTSGKGIPNNYLARRKASMPLLKTLSTVSRALLPITRLRLFEGFRMPLNQAKVDPVFLSVLPTFSATVARVSGPISCAPVIEQASNLQCLTLFVEPSHTSDAPLAALLRAVEKPRPRLEKLNLVSVHRGSDESIIGDGAVELHLTPSLFRHLNFLTYLSVKLTLPHGSWQALFDHISVLEYLKTLVLQPDMPDDGGVLALESTFKFKKLTDLRICHSAHAEMLLPGLLARSPQLESLQLASCRRWQCSRCFARELVRLPIGDFPICTQIRQAYQETTDEIEKADAKKALRGGIHLTDAKDSFLELSQALYGLAPPHPKLSLWKTVDEERRFDERFANIYHAVLGLDLSKLKTLVVNDCAGWRNICSHFFGSGITSLIIKAVKEPIDEADMEADELIGFVDSLPKLKTMRLPLQPDSGYDLDADDELNGYMDGVFQDRAERWEDAMFNLNLHLVDKGVKLIRRDELVKGARWTEW